MFNCAPHFDYKTTFTPRLNQAYLVDFQSYYVRICSYTVDPFLIFEKGSPEGNPIGVQTRTFSESKEQKKCVNHGLTHNCFEQLRTVFSGERGIVLASLGLPEGRVPSIYSPSRNCVPCFLIFWNSPKQACIS